MNQGTIIDPLPLELDMHLNEIDDGESMDMTYIKWHPASSLDALRITHAPPLLCHT